MDTKETFEAVCKRIGDHYSDKENYKVFKKKVKWTGTYLNCEMCFWSSHSNMANEYVCLEIVTSVYANDKTDSAIHSVYTHDKYPIQEIFLLIW